MSACIPLFLHIIATIAIGAIGYMIVDTTPDLGQLDLHKLGPTLYFLPLLFGSIILLISCILGSTPFSWGSFIFFLIGNIVLTVYFQIVKNKRIKESEK